MNAACIAAMYYIWQARNVLLWRQETMDQDAILKQIEFSVISRIRSIMPGNISSKDKSWFESL